MQAPYAHRNMTDFAPDNFGLITDEEIINDNKNNNQLTSHFGSDVSPAIANKSIKYTLGVCLFVCFQ